MNRTFVMRRPCWKLFKLDSRGGDRMPEPFMGSWIVWALFSAAFAALTAIFAKVGVENVNSDLATFIRTVVIIAVLGVILAARGLFQPVASISTRTYLFLGLSGLATGASWLCYFRALQLGDAARVAPVDKLSVVVAMLLAALFLGEHLTWRHGIGAGLIVAGTVIIAKI